MEQLGIQPLQLLMQGINFVVLLFLLKKFLYQPIISALEARKKKIEEGLAYAKKMQEEFEESEKLRADVLQKAKEEARIIVNEAKRTAKVAAGDVVDKAKEEAQQLILRAKRDIEQERETMHATIKKETVDLAHALVENVLGHVLSETQHQRIIDLKIRELASHLR